MASSRGRHQDKLTPSGRLPEKPTPSSRPEASTTPAPPSRKTRQGVATVQAIPPKSRDGRGHSAPYRRRSPPGAALVPLPPSPHQHQAAPCSHDGLSVRPKDDGPHQSERARKTARAPPVGPEGGQPRAVGPPLPRVPRAINQTRHRAATVIARQVAEL